MSILKTVHGMILRIKDSNKHNTNTTTTKQIIFSANQPVK